MIAKKQFSHQRTIVRLCPADGIQLAHQLHVSTPITVIQMTKLFLLNKIVDIFVESQRAAKHDLGKLAHDIGICLEMFFEIL
jgi:hypothetical protein